MESAHQLLADVQHLSGEEFMQVSAAITPNQCADCLVLVRQYCKLIHDYLYRLWHCTGCGGKGISGHVRPCILPQFPGCAQAQGDVQDRCGAPDDLQRW